MASKKKNGSAAVVSAPVVAPPSGSGFTPGKKALRSGKRFIVLYGWPKVRKTTAVSTLHGRKVKWLISDSNAIPTLEALNRIPHPDDTYEVTSLLEAKQLLQQMLEYARANDGLDFDVLACDSVTQYFDWAQAEAARVTSQRFLGDVKDNNGYQLFNADFGEFIDLLSQVSQYVHVIAIAHAKEAPGDDKARTAFKKKGTYAGLNLSPAMAAQLARKANWILYQSLETRYVPDTAENRVSDDYITAEVLPTGDLVKHTETIIHTAPTDLYIGSANSRMVEGENGMRSTLEAEEPANLDLIMVKEGLLEARS
ncbi:MAG: hypothetical protein EPN91_08280 [Salinibacterium sp.]|nr:MAG: hypothetical protein EPN91_08280 [Salinibacterium sp.]